MATTRTRRIRSVASSSRGVHRQHHRRKRGRAGDVISRNTAAGVLIERGTSGNLVEGDLIGTTLSGDTALPNGGDLLAGLGNFLITTPTPTWTARAWAIGYVRIGQHDRRLGRRGRQRHLGQLRIWHLAHVGGDGQRDPGELHRHRRNRDPEAGESGNGVEIDSGATNNTIGGATAAAGNLITGNGRAGVGAARVAIWERSSGNVITANQVFGNTEQDIGVVGTGGPAVVLAADVGGQVEGWLQGPSPISRTHEVYASAGFEAWAVGRGPGLARLVRGDDRRERPGDVRRAVHRPRRTGPPSRPRRRRPACQGSTSDLSHASPGQPRHASRCRTSGPRPAATVDERPGRTIAIQDPGAGPLAPAWDLILTLSAGTLSLSTTVGLTGTGDGTDSLSYSGTSAALDAALAGMVFTPPAGYQGSVTLSLDAQSTGTADPGPGHDRGHLRDLPGHEHRRQRSRLAPPGHPRFRRRPRGDEHDRLRHPGQRRSDHRRGLAPARDHQPGRHRRLLAARATPGYR